MKSPNDYVVNLIVVVSSLIGSRLATIKKSGEAVPAVFPSRSKAPKVSYPYIVIDHLNIAPNGEKALNKYIEDDTKYVEEFGSLYSFSIQVESNQTGDALGIANELKNRLRGSLGVQAISDTLEAELFEMTVVTPASNLMTNDFEEKARFILTVSVIECITEDSPYLIETVSVDGQLTNPDSTTINVNVDVPN